MQDAKWNGWGSVERDIALFRQLSADELLRVFVLACEMVAKTSKETLRSGAFSPAFMRATEKAMVVTMLLGESCAREMEPPKGLQ